MAYLRELEARSQDLRVCGGAPRASDGTGNFLLDYWRSPAQDEANLVVLRNDHGIVMLNRYPYANGHLLVALGDPRPTLMDYASPQRAELWKLVDEAVALVERALNPQGINVGFNQGRAAGAGLPEHLHAHVVPRWAGDVNMMAAIASVRIIPDSLEETAALLRGAHAPK